MPEKRTERCSCCELPFLATVVGSIDRATTDFSVAQNRPRRSLCPECRLHQGDSFEQRLRRYETDQPKLRIALKTAADYAERVEREVKIAPEQVKAALRSRERMASSLKAVQDIHSMRGDGSCTCGAKKQCRTAEALASDRWLQQMLARQDEQFNRREQWMHGGPSRRWVSGDTG